MPGENGKKSDAEKIYEELKKARKELEKAIEEAERKKK